MADPLMNVCNLERAEMVRTFHMSQLNPAETWRLKTLAAQKDCSSFCKERNIALLHGHDPHDLTFEGTVGIYGTGANPESHLRCAGDHLRSGVSQPDGDGRLGCPSSPARSRNSASRSPPSTRPFSLPQGNPNDNCSVRPR